jgi:hypothetical protein
MATVRQTRHLRHLAIQASILACVGCGVAQPRSFAFHLSVEQQTLDNALLLAGSGITSLPIELASLPPDHASRGIEAWTVFRDDGKAARIFVYTASRVFRCSSARWDSEHKCVLKLASILVHEAWHFRHGQSEAGAYNAQIAFLILHSGSREQIESVRANARAVTIEPNTSRRGSSVSRILH